MSLAEIYPWLKALHVASALTFVGGVFAVTIMLDALRIAPSGAIAATVRHWDQAITTPAMLLVWAFGIALGLTSHWFADHWLQAKLVLVAALSGVHGVQSGRLRRAVTQPTAHWVSLVPVVLVATVSIGILAVIKP